MVEKPIKRHRAALAQYEASRLAHEALMKEKAARYRIRCKETLKRLRRRYHDRMAARIQRFFKEYKEDMHMRYKQRMHESMTSVDHSNSMTHVSGTTHISGTSSQIAKSENSTLVRVRNTVTNVVTRPVETLKGVLRSVVASVREDELIPKKDERKLANAILAYQVKTILQEGIVDLHLTVSEIEAKSFELTQQQLRNAGLPSFTRLPEDISGGMNMNVHLWVQLGTGQEVICRIEVHPKPERISNASMKQREEQMRAEHVRLVWHPHIHFEVRGERSIRLGKAAFAIEELKILTNQAVRGPLFALLFCSRYW